MNTCKEDVLEILFDSFFTNEASISVVKQDENRDKRFKQLLKYSYFFSENFGKIYLDENQKSTALIVYSDKKKMTLKLIFWYVFLLFRVIGFKNCKKVVQRLKTLNENRPNEAHVYIWYIGVRKNSRGEGLGSQLMKQIISDHEGKIICLETTKQENELFYEKLGFKKIKAIKGLDYPFVHYQLRL